MNKGGCQKYSLPLALFQSYWHSRFARMTKEWLSGFQCHALLRNKIVPVAIDHEKIFNTGSLDHDIYEQTYVDSIFYSNLYHRLFKNSQSTVELIHEVCATLHEKVSECNDQLDGILDEIPYEAF